MEILRLYLKSTPGSPVYIKVLNRCLALQQVMQINRLAAAATNILPLAHPVDLYDKCTYTFRHYFAGTDEWYGCSAPVILGRVISVCLYLSMRLTCRIAICTNKNTVSRPNGSDAYTPVYSFGMPPNFSLLLRILAPPLFEVNRILMILGYV